jgi:hypothetical protein
MIELPRWVHREQASCRVETLDGLREAESEGWRVNPNEPDVCHADPVDEVEEAALLTELARQLEPDTAALEAADLAAVSEDGQEEAPEGAGEADGGVEGDAVAEDRPKRGRPKKR